MSTPDTEFRHDLAEAVLQLPVAAALGFTFTALAKGQAEAQLPWRPEHSHAPGVFQAGPIASLADFTGATAAVTLLPAGGSVTTVDLTAKFLAEARGDRLVARARVLRPGRILTVTAVDLYADDRIEILAATVLLTVKNNFPRDAVKP